MPASGSNAPEPVTVTDARFCQDVDPPLTTGSPGAERSSRTVAAAVPAAGVQADGLAAASTLRNCTSVSPSAVTLTVAPGWAADQVAPPSVDVRLS